MNRRYRIRVYGAQRKNIDPALLAQVVILFGRHLQQQRQQRMRNHGGVEHPRIDQGSSPSLCPEHPAATSEAGPSSQDTAHTPKNDETPGSVGEGLS